ncbi:MAG: hypothetical protein EBU23_03355 [Mycobacteriaceae bacterium]|nr:hypothetical protein [Mycobacteriaceae bacterium]NBQ41612.1 hypothetical protein [Mycobacteriaceae bacterium]
MGRCCDVVDKGILETAYGPKHKIELRFQVVADGLRYVVRRMFTASLHEKSTLRRELFNWGALADVVNSGNDLEVLLNRPVTLNVVHQVDAKDATKTWANLTAILPAFEDQAPAVVGYDRATTLPTQSPEVEPF